MSKAWCVGIEPTDALLCAINNVHFSKKPDGCTTAILRTEAGDGENLRVLDGSVGRISNMLEDLPSKIQRIVILSDLASLEGGRWANVDGPWNDESGTSLASVHGMGQLMVEIFAKSLANKGRDVVLFRIGETSQERIQQHLRVALSAASNSLRSLHRSHRPSMDGWLSLCLDERGIYQNPQELESWFMTQSLQEGRP
ncbi:MAG: hypothetical protein L7S56_04475 [Candidatus Poseidonia sp.]|nr:hypothetical protein [Poseidonia sp.]